jgi:hypothetical protein
MRFFEKTNTLTLIASAIALYAMVGCKRSSTAPTVAKTAAAVSTVATSREHEIGDLDENGKIVVFSIGDRYQPLETEAALVFHNVGTDTEPQVRFDLTTRGGGHKAYSSVQGLRDDLAKTPELREVDFYGTCGGPPWYGIPEPEVDAFFEAMKEAGVELRELRPDGFINSICTCPDHDK